MPGALRPQRASSHAGSGSAWIPESILPARISMPRTSVALFLTTVALAGATAACSHSPEAGEEGGDKDRQEMTQPASPSPASKEDSEGGEGGEGGEG